jgi:hypothetical protein
VRNLRVKPTRLLGANDTPLMFLLAKTEAWRGRAGSVLETGRLYYGHCVRRMDADQRDQPPRDLTAYEYYLLGMEAKHKVTKEGLNEAEGLFRAKLSNSTRVWPELTWGWSMSNAI